MICIFFKRVFKTFTYFCSGKNDDSKNYTVEAYMKTLSRIEATRNPSTNEYNVLYELTKHQKEILNCLGLTQKVVNKTYKYWFSYQNPKSLGRK